MATRGPPGHDHWVTRTLKEVVVMVVSEGGGGVSGGGV